MSGKFPVDPGMFENNEELGALRSAAGLHFPPEMVDQLLLAALAMKEPREPDVPELDIYEPGVFQLPTQDPDRSMWIIVGPGKDKPKRCPTCGKPWH